MKVPAWLGVRSTSRINFRDREKWGDWPSCLILSFFLRNFTVWGPQSHDITALSESCSKTSSHWRLHLSTLILGRHCISVIIFQTVYFILLCCLWEKYIWWRHYSMGSFSLYLLCGKHSMKASHYLNSAFSISFPCLYFIAVHCAASARLSPCVSLHRCFVSIWVNFRFFILISNSPLKRLRHKFFSQKDSYKAIPITHTHIPSQIFPENLRFAHCFQTACSQVAVPPQSLIFNIHLLYFRRKRIMKNGIIKHMVLKINYFFSSERIFSTILNTKKLSKILTYYNWRFMSFVYLITKHSSYTMGNRSSNWMNDSTLHNWWLRKIHL